MGFLQVDKPIYVKHKAFVCKLECFFITYCVYEQRGGEIETQTNREREREREREMRGRQRCGEMERQRDKEMERQ